MRELIPEMIEIFELSREHLDILRDGQFTNLDRDVWVSIAFEEWDVFEWFTDEERNALAFLFTSEELSRNFIWIYSWRETPTLTAVLFEQGGGGRFDRIEIWHGESEYFDLRIHIMHSSYSVYLGDGYTLWVYTVRGPASIPFA